jgi:hypothetical protein
MSVYTYPVDIPDISYTNDAEYQDQIRMLFRMKAVDTDDDPSDEYDENAAIRAMDSIYEATKQSALFEKVYVLAANKLFLEDPAMGLPILFSYDYLDVFHRCLVHYLRTPETFDETTAIYQELLSRVA